MSKIIRVELEACYCLLMALVLTHPDRKLLGDAFDAIASKRIQHPSGNPGYLRDLLANFRAMISTPPTNP